MSQEQDDSATQRLFTLRQVLDFDVMQGATILAGSEGLDRRVRGVNIIEVPDVWKWLDGGELLLSAGYAWRDCPEGMATLVDRLESAQVAGIAFKLGRYLDRVPANLLARSNEVGLPVVSLPADVAYRQVLESLYGSLMPRAAPFDLSPRAKQAFTHFGLDEQSIGKVVGSVARQLDCETMVVNLLDDEVIVASRDGSTERVPFTDLEDTGVALLEGLKSKVLNRAPSEVSLGSRNGLGSALIIGHRRQGYIFLEGKESFDEATFNTVAHAGELVSFLLLKRLAFLEGRQQAGGLFLRSLMSDSLSNEEAVEGGLTFGLRLTKPSAFFVWGFLSKGPISSEWLDHALGLLHRALGQVPHVVTSGHPPGTLLALVQVTDEEWLCESLRQAMTALAEWDEIGRSVIGLGSQAVGVDAVRRSQSEALIAHEAGVRMQEEGLMRFRDIGVERLLSQIPPGEIVNGYIQSILGPLLGDPELLKTVELYLKNGRNKAATAAEAHLHRSSLVYRLKKASDLGVDLNSPERCLELWLAIRLRRMFVVSRA